MAFSNLRALAAAAAGLAILAAGPLAYAGYILAIENTHAVAPGAVYRSAQPEAEDLAEMVRDHGIKSVVNLRGPANGRGWYEQEKSATATLHIAQFDFPMSANRVLPPARARELIALIAQAPKPVLIHCQAGADRSGLAAALYLYAVAHESAETAAGQLSLAYGHFPYLWSRTGAMEDSLKQFIDRTDIASDATREAASSAR